MKIILKKKIRMCLFSLLLGAVLTVTSIFAYAYFSKKDIYDGYLSGRVELLFDHLSETGFVAYEEATGVVTNPEADWGSEENPYVISNVRHLYNLSELQKLGYFYNKHISKNEEGEYTNIPHFLVCTPEYQPVLIDGSNFRDITAIGDENYPFIGSVIGITGDEKISVGGNASDTSMLYDITVKGSPDKPDVGLFGHIGYLGTPPAVGSEETTFEGQPSTVSNLVLNNVCVKVENTLLDAVEKFFDDIVASGDGTGHRFVFSDLYGTDNYNKVPHENHHIGILAGHVEYSTVEYISVYYGSDDIVAIDLKDMSEVDGTKANYLSAAGIIGFLYNLNPSFDEGTGQITAGSGSSVSDLTYSAVGGGGALSGEMAGYILAKEIYDKYHYIGAGVETPTEGTINIKDATDENGNPLCHEWIQDQLIGGETATGKYYFYDGVFTFALSTDSESQSQDVIEPTWLEGTDDFILGSTDRADWTPNYSKGIKAVSAYLSPILSDKDLQDAIDAGKPLIISKETSTDRAFLMSLYGESQTGSSWTNLQNKFYVGGAGLDYGDEEYIDSLVEAYDNGNSQEFIDGFEIYGGESVADMMAAIDDQNSGWKVFDFGHTTSEISIEQLRAQYRIDATNPDNYTFFTSNGIPVSVSEEGMTDYYDYADDPSLNGYFYYTEQRFLIWTTYEIFWYSKDGTKTESFSSSNPNSIFTTDNSDGEWHGETVYTYTLSDGTECRGVVVNANGTFYTTGDTANAQGTTLTKPLEDIVKYFFKPIGSDKYYYITDTTLSTPYLASDLELTGETTVAGIPFYRVKNDTAKEGILLDRYYAYTFSSGDNTMRIIKAVFNSLAQSGTQYALWNGTDGDAQDKNNFNLDGILGSGNVSTVSNSTIATVRFNTDGTCYIGYAIDGATRYINYNTTNFNTALHNGIDSTKLHIYALEATQELDFGRVTFEPKVIDEDLVFQADEHVLYATTDANGNTTYEVMPVEDLPNLGSDKTGWNNSMGGTLSAPDLQKKFRMIHGIDFGISLSIEGWGSLSTDGLITAPVGSAGTQANIPMSCVAFRVNKEGVEQHIRVIVSVARSEAYVGETDNMGNSLNTLGDFKRHFNLWQVPEAGGTGFDMFRKDDYLERFEIPISHPYEPGTYPTDESSAQGFYDNITYQGTPYGMYMNGDRVLVAYEFTVSEVGLYVLGASGEADDSEVPMEIVYFAADGVASAGRDGESASQLGSIDFVYSYNNEIITVKDSSSTDTSGNEDYSTFYPSYCILYFDSSKKDGENYVSIRNERVYIRRYITDSDPPTSSDGYNTTTSRATIGYLTEEDKNARVAQYARLCDNVIER
ncbi:MAG: hypothetical protein IKC72_02070 [Clostridia bacterium]|nr:hypothetical protein [Clostridia bacterium]